MSNSIIQPIAIVETKGLQNLENNYLRLNKEEGGKYSLVEVRRELQRRQGGIFDGKTVFDAILSLAKESSTGFISYGELFTKLHQIPWIGHGCQALIKRDLGAVIYYCIQNNFPIVTSLVIRQNESQLTDLAKQNIYDCAKRLGVKGMSSSVEVFIDKQQTESLALLSKPTH